MIYEKRTLIIKIKKQMKKAKYSILILGLILLMSFSYNLKMTKNEILISQGIYAIMPYDFEYDFKYKVLSYDWVFKAKNDTYFGSSKGSNFPEDLVKYIKAGNSNDILFIENVKVLGDDERIRKVSGLTVVLK